MKPRTCWTTCLEYLTGHPPRCRTPRLPQPGISPCQLSQSFRGLTSSGWTPRPAPGADVGITTCADSRSGNLRRAGRNPVFEWTAAMPRRTGASGVISRSARVLLCLRKICFCADGLAYEYSSPPCLGLFGVNTKNRRRLFLRHQAIYGLAISRPVATITA